MGQSFESVFREALTQGLRPIFGDVGVGVVYDRLRLPDVRYNPAELHDRLFSIFGESGASVVELWIVNWLQSSLSLGFEIDRRNSNFLERNCTLARQAFEYMKREGT